MTPQGVNKNSKDKSNIIDTSKILAPLTVSTWVIPKYMDILEIKRA